MCGRDRRAPAAIASVNARLSTASSRLMVAFFAPSPCRRATYRRTSAVVIAAMRRRPKNGACSRTWRCTSTSDRFRFIP